MFWTPPPLFFFFLLPSRSGWWPSVWRLCSRLRSQSFQPSLRMWRRSSQRNGVWWASVASMFRWALGCLLSEADDRHLLSSVSVPTPPERFFISVCCFLTFNIFDWFGRTVTTLIRWVGVRSSPCRSAILSLTSTLLRPELSHRLRLFSFRLSHAASQRVPPVPVVSGLQGGLYPSADAL